MFQSDRLRWLEQNGIVPEDADDVDWQLAQQTSWWGKQIDAKQFWKDKVVWLDKSAEDAARRLGRGYPPMPYKNSSLPKYPDDDGIDWTSFASEGPVLHFATSSLENAFWDQFTKMMPHPPEVLAREQKNVAATIFKEKFLYENGGNPQGKSAERIASHKTWEIGRARVLGCPSEALDSEALFWDYVIEARCEYESRMKHVREDRRKDISKEITEEFAIDPKLIVEPLTEDQLKAANAWKITYLQRLRREKVDESYINAYLKAWNLTPMQVFGAN